MTFYMVVSFYIYDCFEIINEDDSQNYGQHYNHPQHGSLLLHKNYRQKTVSRFWLETGIKMWED